MVGPIKLKWSDGNTKLYEEMRHILINWSCYAVHVMEVLLMSLCGGQNLPISNGNRDNKLAKTL